MLYYLLAFTVLFVAGGSMLLIKELEALPILERKRRARTDTAHKQLYALRAHGLEAYVLLWGLMIISLCSFVAATIRAFSPLVSAVLIILILGIQFGWLWHARWRLPINLAALCARLVEKLATWFAPVLRQIAKIVRPLLVPSRDAHMVYEKADLLQYIHTLRRNADIRIPADDLKLVENSLTYADKHISAYMTPRRMVQTISADEQVGPVLLDELHKSGFSRLPVFSGAEDNIVGTLHVKDLLDVKDGKTIAQVMQRKAYYVHEDLSLAHALKAFLKTKCHLFMVVNQFQEIVGVITIEDVLEQIIGQPIVDEFDQYDDLRAVAALHAKQDRQANAEQQV